MQRTIDEQGAAFRPSRPVEQAAAARSSRSAEEEERRRRSAQRLRQEQDAAYMESLRKDQVIFSCHGSTSISSPSESPALESLPNCNLLAFGCRRKKDPERVSKREFPSREQATSFAQDVQARHQENLPPRRLRSEHPLTRKLHLHTELNQTPRYDNG